MKSPNASPQTPARERAKLTKTVVDRTEFTHTGQRTIWDTQIPGFCLRVGINRKTYTLQRDFRRDGQRVTARRALGIAEVANGKRVPTITIDEARKAALALIAQLNRGIDPKLEEQKQKEQAAQEERERGLTLRQAIKLHTKSNGKGNKPRAERTEANYEHFVTKGYLAAWMDRPLRSIKRMEVYERHQELTKEIAAGKYAGKKAGRRVPSTYDGRTTANQVFRWFRAVYTRAGPRVALDGGVRPDSCARPRAAACRTSSRRGPHGGTCWRRFPALSVRAAQP